MLWMVCVALFWLSFTLFVKRGKKEELKSLKMTYYAYGFTSLMLGFVRIFFVVAVYDLINYHFWVLLGYLSGVGGLIFWLYVCEKYLLMNKTKKVFTFICVVVFCVSLVALAGLIERSIALDIQYILLPVALAVIAFVYIYIIVKTTGTVRIKAKWILIGIFLIAIAQVLDGEDFITALPWFPLWIPPIIMAVGIVIMIVSQLYYERS